MPEIIEVEKLRRQLEPAWRGRSIVRFQAPANSPNPRKYAQDGWDFFSKRIKHCYIRGVDRIGKNLWVKTSEYSWHIHLGSTGWFSPASEEAWDAVDGTEDPIVKNFIHSINPQNIRMSLTFDDGQRWHYHDPRTWGKWWAKPYNEMLDDPYFQDYGPDWLSSPFRASTALIEVVSRRTAKDVLCDQKVTAGIGNYLSCEILHRAGIHPHRSFNDISVESRTMLAVLVKAVLYECMKRKDHSHWRVFQRAGERCLSCGGEEIEYVKDGGSRRGSYFCRQCQPI